jgi:hypothetical protein
VVKPKPDSGPRRPPERLLDLGQGLAIWRVHVDDLAEQPLNAQAMPPDMFARLKKTIETDARLESLPFCALTSSDPPRIELVSGHHRTRAARAAELFYVYVMVDETGLDPDWVKAKQLAHNAINGESEPQMLQRIYESITDVDARLESFIQPVTELPAPVRMPRLDVDLGYRVVQFVFLPHQADAFDAAMTQFTDDGALVDDAALYLVDKELDERWRAACRRMGKEHAARAVTVQVARLVAAAMAHLGGDPADPDPDEWVPLADILGSALVPPAAAEVIRRAVDGMTKAGRATPKRGWEAVLELAGDYAGQGGPSRP